MATKADELKTVLNFSDNSECQSSLKRKKNLMKIIIALRYDTCCMFK